MYLKIFANVIAIIFFAALQIGFVSSLPLWLKEINLFPAVLVLLLGFSSPRTAYLWAFGLGFLADVYLFAPFGIHAASLLLATAGANFLLKNFLTNRSVYAFLLLGASASIGYELCLYLFYNSINLIFSRGLAAPGSQTVIYKLYAVGAELALLAACLYALNHFGAGFKPVFLRKSKIR